MITLEGKKAPAFSLPGSDGKTHDLKDYRGRCVLLYFYPKDDTPGCTREACGFRDGFAELSRAGVTVLGVSRDPVASHLDFIEKYTLPFVLLADEDTSVMQAYGAWGEKMRYGKPVIGTIRSTALINGDGKVIKHWSRVTGAEEHPEEVLAFIRKMNG